MDERAGAARGKASAARRGVACECECERANECECDAVWRCCGTHKKWMKLRIPQKISGIIDSLHCVHTRGDRRAWLFRRTRHLFLAGPSSDVGVRGRRRYAHAPHVAALGDDLACPGRCGGRHRAPTPPTRVVGGSARRGKWQTATVTRGARTAAKTRRRHHAPFDK